MASYENMRILSGDTATSFVASQDVSCHAGDVTEVLQALAINCDTLVSRY